MVISSERKYDLGRSPFLVTWSGYNPGNEKLWSEQDKRILPGKKFINPEGFKRAGIFYTNRWIYTGAQPFKLGEQQFIFPGDVYYNVSIFPGSYSFKDVHEGHKKLVNLTDRDNRVSLLTGITWIGDAVKRWGWQIAVENLRVSDTYYTDIAREINSRLSRLKRHGQQHAFEHLLKHVNKSRRDGDSLFKPLRIVFIYMPVDYLKERYQ